MTVKKEDRRILRTRRMMHEALIALIVEKGYESVRVQDILDRADVGRSTFYSHYRDKDELLLSGFSHLRTLFERQQPTRPSEDGGIEVEFAFILEFFRHAGQHRQLYKAMVGKQSGQMMLKYLHKYLFDLLKEPVAAIVKSRKAPTVPVDITVHWLVSSLLTLLTWWLDNSVPCSAEKLHEHFRMLTLPGIEAALGARSSLLRSINV